MTARRATAGDRDTDHRGAKGARRGGNSGVRADPDDVRHGDQSGPGDGGAGPGDDGSAPRRDDVAAVGFRPGRCRIAGPADGRGPTGDGRRYRSGAIPSAAAGRGERPRGRVGAPPPARRRAVRLGRVSIVATVGALAAPVLAESGDQATGKDERVAAATAAVTLGRAAAPSRAARAAGPGPSSGRHDRRPGGRGRGRGDARARTDAGSGKVAGDHRPRRRAGRAWRGG